MKNIIYFITYRTLGIEHARAVLTSLSNQVVSDQSRFDVMYIYNTHQDELLNSDIMALCDELKLHNHIASIEEFNYDLNTPKTLAGDVNAVCAHARALYSPDDRMLILKSDTLLSKNYFDDVLHLPPGPVFFTNAFVCAKARIPDSELFEYASRDRFVRSDDITFFVEDHMQSNNNDFHMRPGVSVTDESIHFTACTVIRDFSCHFVTIGLTPLFSMVSQSWGGVNCSMLIPYWRTSDRSFTLHKFHDIKSENRSTGREGPVVDWLSS